MSKITCVLLNGQQAVILIDRLLDRSQQPKLNDLQSTIVLETWVGNTYKSIADRLSYDLDYIKQIAARLWKLLSKLLGESICKSNIKSVLERYQESIPIADWREPILGMTDWIDDRSGCDSVEIELPTAETWMISDRMTTIAFLCASESNTVPQSLKLDRQVQHQLESLIYQNSYKPFTPNVLMKEILSVLAVRDADINSINCLIVNCYFDRQDSYQSIIDN
jgi:hypothetical protein